MCHVAMLHVAWRVLHVAGRVLSAAWAGHGYACCTLHVVLYAARCMSHDACCVSRFVAFVPFGGMDIALTDGSRLKYPEPVNGWLISRTDTCDHCQTVGVTIECFRYRLSLMCMLAPFSHRCGPWFGMLALVPRVTIDPMPSVPLPWAPTSRFI